MYRRSSLSPILTLLTEEREIYSMSLKISFFLLCCLFLSFRCSSILASETYRTDNVLVSKESARYVGDYSIRQERYKIGEVLVSRPNPTDTIILDVLKTNQIRSLEDYTKWLPENIKYKRDEGGDFWAQPECDR